MEDKSNQPMANAESGEVEWLGDLAKTVVVSVNPKSGASDQRSIVDQLANELTSAGLTVVLLTDIEKVKSESNRLSDSGSQEGIRASRAL